MDLEQLNKTQIVLLTLLVSFVTSIATGIVSVTLLDQAPPGVTQTINRVVERTVERVVPQTTTAQTAAAIKETTVVVKEDDLITDSIAKNRGTLLRIIARDQGGNSPTLAGLGVVLDGKGIAATLRSVFSDAFTYTAQVQSGEEYPIKILNLESRSPIALIALQPKKEVKLSLSSVTIPSSLSLKLGQTVIALSGEARDNVSIGIISGLEQAGEEATSTLLFVHATPLAQTGSPLFNMFGEMVGIRTTSLDASQYLPSSSIATELKNLPTSQ